MDFHYQQMNVLRMSGQSSTFRAVLSLCQASSSWWARMEVRGRGLLLETPVYFQLGYDRLCWSGAG